MTQSQFRDICAYCLVAPAVALENEKVREALKNRDDEEVKRILEEEF